MPLIRSTGRDTGSPVDDGADRPLRWSGGLSLTGRILIVNIVALLMLAGSFFYLDGFRIRMIDERVSQSLAEAKLIAIALAGTEQAERDSLASRIADQSGVRIRIVDQARVPVFDSWTGREPSFHLRDPAVEGWQRRVAGWLDDGIDTIVGAEVLPRFGPFPVPARDGIVTTLAPDRTHMITTSVAIPESSDHLVTDNNARDIRRVVRAERYRLGLIVGVTTIISILLSLFLARTIAQPLRRLARAAVRVRMGRARDVVVPRLPSRTDEIGMLARAVSDMNQTLHMRIDATEAFAADVAHELKNPLASLSSAVESLAAVKDPALKEKLMAIITEDVRRLDRLITDIADLSRIEAVLGRTRFEKIDLGGMIETLIEGRTARRPEIGARIAFARPKRGSAVVMGDPSRLTRVVENLLDNALSFSPEDAVVMIAAARSDGKVVISVEDQGPGIPASRRNAIFERFHSDRPDEDAFGKHSGLGLSIAKAVVDAHDGQIEAQDRGGGERGARIVVTLPAA